MAKMRPMSVLLILVSSGISILIGVLLDRGSPGGTSNYRAVYYGVRCLIHRVDPYNPDGFLRVYAAESGEFPSAPARRHLFLRAVPVCVNLPTTLFLVAPLALLPWGLSRILWLTLIGLSLTLAGLLMFDIAAEFAPGVSLGQGIDTIRGLERTLHLPDDIRAEFRGEAGEATKAGIQQLLLFLAAMFAVYVVLGVLY